MALSRTLLAGALMCGVCAGVVRAGQNQAQPVPTFRAGTDLIELDVSALDKNRHPVHGLTADDFTVTIDGHPGRVAAFKAVDVASALVGPPTAPWIRDVARDVATNTRTTDRVIVIVMDDGSFPEMSGTTAPSYLLGTMRRIAHSVVASLGPNDLAAVVYTENNRTAQDFTTDRQLLSAAIDKSAMIPSNYLAGDERGSCYCGLCSVEALEHVSDALRSLPQQRKIVVYVSVGLNIQVVPLDDPSIAAGTVPDALISEREMCRSRKQTAMVGVFKAAQQSNVTIEAVGAEGLVGDGMISANAVSKSEYLKTVAQMTGGRAVVNDNEMERQVPALLEESSSYYLLGVERSLVGDDGHLHQIRVKVDRPGVEVRTRNNFYAPTAKEKAAAAIGPADTMAGALADALPKNDIPLDVSLAPLAGAGKTNELAVVVGVGRARGPAPNPREAMDVEIRAFNPENGTFEGTWHQKMTIAWNGTSSAADRFDILGHVPVPPGRYELRIAVQANEMDRGSVYAYADVPNYAQLPLALSGLIMSVTPGQPSGPKEAFAGLLPVIPTTTRMFRSTDRVSAFLRIYQRGARTMAPVTVVTRIVDARNHDVVSDTKRIDPSAFGDARASDVRFDGPRDLPDGEYLLSMLVTAGSQSGIRQARFTIHP